MGKKRACHEYSVFYLKLLCQVLVLLPVDRRPNGMVVEEIARISSLFLITIGLFLFLVLKELVGGENERELEAWLGGGVGDPDVNEVLQGPSIATDDEFRRFDVILERRQPELWDLSCTGGIRWKFFVES